MWATTAPGSYIGTVIGVFSGLFVGALIHWNEYAYCVTCHPPVWLYAIGGGLIGIVIGSLIDSKRKKDTANKSTMKRLLLLIIGFSVFSLVVSFAPILFEGKGCLLHESNQRCLMMWGHKMGLCARCTGILFGTIVGAFLVLKDVRTKLILIPVFSLAILSIFCKFIGYDLPIWPRCAAGFALGTSMVFVFPILCEWLFDFTSLLLCYTKNAGRRSVLPSK
ncbi:DUF2085 domain-containing protein [bacterium]|nr:DUF2085 domain-containing protein [bacterium]